jgi:hypothetical protein
VSTTAAVESTTATAVEASSTYAVAATGKPASNPARSAETAAAITRASIAVAGPPITVTGASVETAAIAINPAVAVSITAAEPGTGTDKEAAVEPRGAIVSVGRAGVGIIAIVAIGTDGSITVASVAPVDRPANSNSNRNLRVGISRSGNQQNTE